MRYKEENYMGYIIENNISDEEPIIHQIVNVV